jgi:glycosyltransferase involved in cell wall biosynthesis
VQPLVSVIVPAYNAGSFIDAALRSAAEQSYRPLEILVADDGSTDATHECVLRWMQRADVRWIEAPVRAGRPSVPRNRALRAARGEFVAFLDADDLWTAHKIADQVSAFAAHPELVMVYSALRAFGRGMRFSSAQYGLKPWPTRAALSREALEAANTVPCSSVLVRRDVVDRLGGFDEDPELQAVEDYDLWLRVSAQGPIAFIPRVHGRYRVHADGISRDAAVQRQRAEYLVRKRQLHGFTFREFRQRTPMQTLMRNAADLAVTAAMQFGERAMRVYGSVPVWRCSHGGTIRS